MTSCSPPSSTLVPIPSSNPSPPALGASPSHHVSLGGGAEPTGFCRPWASAKPQNLSSVIYNRFFRYQDRNFVPVPPNREGLVQIRQPSWGADNDSKCEKLKATWIGHASWLIEFPAVYAKEEGTTDETNKQRGVRILLDPVFSERTSPVSWAGPKRYTPTPCTIAELPEVDAVVISHNHYDHLDVNTIKTLWKKQGGQLKILCPLKNKSWFLDLTGVQFMEDDVMDMDWWDGVKLEVQNLGSVRIICTPAQHFSSRGPTDRDKSLWSSWVFESDEHGKSLYFAGDTGYRHVPVPHPTPEEESAQPVCPAFKEIGTAFGPFDLALLPIGLCTPRDFMSTVHCSPEDAICIHMDIKAKKSVGMHYGTVRGGISELYEDVLEPPRRFKEISEEKGLIWGSDVGLCDVGETILV